MGRNTNLVGPLFLVSCVLAGCVSYEPRPLDAAATVREIDQRRSTPPSETPSSAVTFGQAAAWRGALGPDILEAVSRYETALARARVPTPIPNPMLELGPTYGFGSDIDTRRVGGFGALGITLPLGGRLQRTDDLDRVRAEVARVDGVARHRELFLQLRARWIEAIAAQRQAEAQVTLEEAAATSLHLMKRRVEAGSATAVDVALFELELGRRRTEKLQGAAAVTRSLFRLSELVGVNHESLQPLDLSLPTATDDEHTLQQLKQRLVTHHPELARLRARYEEAEAQLRLEVSKQYPDLVLGPNVDKDTGESKTVLGLALGIPLPFFDRNQKAIAEAEHRREEVRVRYEAEASRALAKLEQTCHELRLRTAEHEALRTDVLPAARRGVELARAATQAGPGDVLKTLAAERSFGVIQLEVTRAELAVLTAWAELEGAVGMPLIRFPGNDAGLSAPSRLKPTQDRDVMEVNR